MSSYILKSHNFPDLRSPEERDIAFQAMMDRLAGWSLAGIGAIILIAAVAVSLL